VSVLEYFIILKYNRREVVVNRLSDYNVAYPDAEKPQNGRINNKKVLKK
jgi:hypothetical protein